jgi:hypothetical protein
LRSPSRLKYARIIRWLPAAIFFLAVACSGATATPSSSATPSGVGQNGTSTPLATPTDRTPAPPPTRNPDTTNWVEARLDAVVDLYQPTRAGVALLRSLDLRQMEGEPGFFGSYGFAEWAGVGEASPIGVIHELSHSYWGGFPVDGRPDLSWVRTTNHTPNTRSTAMESYHKDILAFMAQPPDDYELFRQRMRNLLDISSDNTEPVLHNMEADMVYNTGGSLKMVPPILQKYWVDFLSPGRFGNWYDAAGWFQALSDDDRKLASKWLGFEHLDLRDYPILEATPVSPEVMLTARIVIEAEERQRLWDLVYQFDLLIGDSQNEEDFEFWRRYLRDKITLRQAHPAYLALLSHSRAGQFDSAMRFIESLTNDSPAEQAALLADQLLAEPFLVNLLPAVDNRILVELFSSGAELPEGQTLQATASFVERLKVFGAKVDSVLQAGRSDPSAGAAELGSFLSETGLEQEDDIKLFFDLFKDRDREVASAVTLALPGKTLRELMLPVPFQLRSLLSPSELLSKLGITYAASDSPALRAAIALLVEEPSGNFRVDEPYLEAMFEVVAQRTGDSPHEAAQLLLDTPFPLEGFILAQPAAAAAIFDSRMAVAVELVQTSDSLLAPPWRIMYRLVQADPSLAANILSEFHRRGETRLVAESLAHMAYDKDRQERSSLLPISLEADGLFLGELFQDEGADWLEVRLSESVSLFRQRVEDDEVSPEFLERYRDTLEFAAAFLNNPETRTGLTGVIRRAFGLS